MDSVHTCKPLKRLDLNFNKNPFKEKHFEWIFKFKYKFIGGQDLWALPKHHTIFMVKAFLLCKNGLRPPPFLGGAHKKSSKTFNKIL